jgi:hypothetical protein
MNKTLLSIALLSLTACNAPSWQTRVLINQDAGMTCALTCIAKGKAATAGHCSGDTSPTITTADPDCGEIVTRDARTGEGVTVEGMALGDRSSRVEAVIDPNWLGWLIVTGLGTPGESGGGVYGADGALLGVVVETRDGMTYARRVGAL